VRLCVAMGSYKESWKTDCISRSIPIYLSRSTHSCHHRQTMSTPLKLAITALASFAIAGPLTTSPSYLLPYPSPCSLTLCDDRVNSCGQTYGGCYPFCTGYPTPTFTDPGCDPSNTPIPPTYPDPRCSITVTVTQSYPFYPSTCSSSSTTTTYSSSTSPTG
jgi:hypothetical protein